MALETFKIINNLSPTCSNSLAVTFRAIPGFNQTFELGEAVFPPEMIRKAIPK
jgi:hypothetical protein